MDKKILVKYLDSEGDTITLYEDKTFSWSCWSPHRVTQKWRILNGTFQMERREEHDGYGGTTSELNDALTTLIKAELQFREMIDDPTETSDYFEKRP